MFTIYQPAIFGQMLFMFLATNRAFGRRFAVNLLRARSVPPFDPHKEAIREFHQ